MVIARFFFFSAQCQVQIKVVQDVNKYKENGLRDYLNRKARE